MREHVLVNKIMNNIANQRIWVAVRVQRGYISDVRAYGDEKSARCCELSWRRVMNPDYDEVGLAEVSVKPKRKSARWSDSR